MEVFLMAKSAVVTRMSGQKAPGELFDLNTVTITGEAIGLWGRNGDVFVRLRVQPLLSPPAADFIFVNVRISNGELNGSPVTLQKGDLLKVTGYIRQNAFTETIRNVLDAAGKIDFLDQNVPPEDLAAWRSISFKRQNALVEAVKIERLAEIQAPVNTIDVEGIVSKVWTYSRGEVSDVFVRLAVYDEHTIETDHEGNWGRKRRIAHYVNALFVEGKPLSASEPVQLKAHQRIRVRGELRDRWSSSNLHQMLVETGDKRVIELLQKVPNKEDLQFIKCQHEHLHILVNAAVVYSR
jgi:hypothetical protein